jgi:hypothetical protein
MKQKQKHVVRDEMIRIKIILEKRKLFASKVGKMREVTKSCFLSFFFFPFFFFWRYWGLNLGLQAY